MSLFIFCFCVFLIYKQVMYEQWFLEIDKLHVNLNNMKCALAYEFIWTTKVSWKYFCFKYGKIIM